MLLSSFFLTLCEMFPKFFAAGVFWYSVARRIWLKRSETISLILNPLPHDRAFLRLHSHFLFLFCARLLIPRRLLDEESYSYSFFTDGLGAKLRKEGFLVGHYFRPACKLFFLRFFSAWPRKLQSLFHTTVLSREIAEVSSLQVDRNSV